MTAPIGYWVDCEDGDMYACSRCVESRGLSTDNPVYELICRLPCGLHS